MTALGVEKDESKPKIQTAFGKKVHRTFEDAVSAYAYGDQPKEKPDKIYRYDNEDGSENLFMLRWNDLPSRRSELPLHSNNPLPLGAGLNDQNNVQKGCKRVRPITKVDGGYICGESTAGALPIYNLPKIAKHIRESTGNVRIIATEGEKAADCATSLGFDATTSAFGSGSSHKADWAVLDRLALKYGKKLELVILPDNDEPGRKYAENVVDVFMTFKSQPIVKVVSICDFKDMMGIAEFPKGGDLFDLCEMLDSKTNEEIAAMIESMVAKSPVEVEIVENDAGRSVYCWRDFPLDVLPDTVAQHVVANAAASGCDPANVALADLVVLASAIGNSRRLQLKRGWIFPSILWGMIVARKGAVKT